jgi:hypothetical protein
VQEHVIVAMFMPRIVGALLVLLASGCQPRRSFGYDYQRLRAAWEQRDSV